MNAFTLILLGWPFYLMVNGKLTTYVTLAKPSATQATGASAPAASSTGGAA
jgi:hypothetical protein